MPPPPPMEPEEELGAGALAMLGGDADEVRGQPLRLL